MTELLQQAIAAVEQLPSTQQDAIAQRLLDDLEDETIWQAQFQATTDEQWDQLADLVRNDIAQRSTEPFEALFPDARAAS